jgi:periplasmic protein TonB
MIAGRIGRMGIVAGMHVAAFFMIATSLGIVSTSKAPDVLTGTVINEPRVIENPDPVEGPTLERPNQVTLPMPVVPVESAGEDGITAERVEPDRLLPSEGSGSAVAVPDIVPPRMDARRPLTQPPYPASEVRAGNQGNADVEVYVLPNGRVGDARILRSTGFEKLDRSALEEAKRNWRLIPATRDGEPVAQWYKVRVTFKITNQ